MSVAKYLIRKIRHLMPLVFPALVLAGIQPAAASYKLGSIQADPRNKAAVEVTTAFSEIPMQGFMPLRVRLDNASRTDRTYILQTRSRENYGQPEVFYEEELEVEAGSSGQFELLVPLTIASQDSYSNLRLEVNLLGPGMKNTRQEMTTNYSTTHRGKLPPLVVFGESFGRGTVSNISDVMSNRRSMELSHVVVDQEFLPSDWRGWLGADLVVMSLRDLEDLGSGSLRGLRQWLAFGGELVVTHPQGELGAVERLLDPENWAPVKGGDPRQAMIGLGKMTLIEDSAPNTVSEKEIAEVIMERIDADTRLMKQIYGGYGRAGITDVNAGVDLNAPIILIFMVAFAILVGPVNLFVFARGNKRYRLFWTTPLISVGTSLLLFGVILLQDGVGGNGSRLTLNVVLSGQNEMVQLQEQMSRTGLLIDRDFRVKEASAVFPVSLPSQGISGRRVYQGGLGNMNLRYQDRLQLLSGDWFQSRNYQGQLLMNLLPARARIDFVPNRQGDAPTILSNFNTPLEELYYVDAQENVWIARNVKSGEEHQMESYSAAALADEVKAFRNLSEGLIDELLDRRLQVGPHFLAVTHAAADDTRINTLKSIRWKTQPALFLQFLPDQLNASQNPAEATEQES